MKYVRVKNPWTEEVVLVDWDNRVASPNKKLNLKVGDDMVVFYKNNQRSYDFSGEPYYTKPYHPQEILDHMKRRNPQINKMIEMFDLVLGI